MKPKKQQFHPELFQARLDQIIDMKHSLARLAKAIDQVRVGRAGRLRPGGGPGGRP